MIRYFIIAVLALIAIPIAVQTFGSTQLVAASSVMGCGREDRCPDPLFGPNLSGAEARDSDVLRPTLNDLKDYLDRYGFKLIRYPFKPNRITAQ